MKQNKDLNGYISKNSLNISVDNLGELTDLINQVEIKEKELQEAVRKLAIFDLKITFEQT